MVVTKKTTLPTIEELETTEVNLSTAHLMAAAPYLGKYCESVNNEFMLCRAENHGDPRPCVGLGKEVTGCSLKFFRRIKKHCLNEHMQYANCVDKSSGDFKPWQCRKTQAVYEGCIKDKLNITNPGLGYFARARVHSSPTTKPEKHVNPCLPKPGKEPDRLPDDAERKPARFGGRSYWMTE